MDGHVSGNGEWHKERKSSGWLWQNPDGVDDGVRHTTQSCSAEQVHGEGDAGIRESIEEAGDDQRNDVLEVVAMGTE